MFSIFHFCKLKGGGVGKMKSHSVTTLQGRSLKFTSDFFWPRVCKIQVMEVISKSLMSKKCRSVSLKFSNHFVAFMNFLLILQLAKLSPSATNCEASGGSLVKINDQIEIFQVGVVCSKAQKSQVKLRQFTLFEKYSKC